VILHLTAIIATPRKIKEEDEGMMRSTAQGLPCDSANFARVESLLRSSDFDDRAVAAFEDPSLSHLGSVKPEQADLSAAQPELSILIRLFLFLEAVRPEDVECLIDSAALKSFLELDLLRTGFIGGGEAYYSSVLLCPVAGLFVASDRHQSVDGSAFIPPPDAVFPAAFVVRSASFG
jgi:hypothetical protein